MTLFTSSRAAVGFVAASLLVTVACGPASGASGTSATDQAAGASAAPPAVPPTPGAPPQQGCTSGMFKAAAAEGVSASPDRATVRERLVTFDVEHVRAMPPTLNLNLFDDVCVTAGRQTQEAGPVPMWVGAVDGIPGSQVTLIFNPGAAAGTVVVPPRAYQLELAREGVYRLREVDTAQYANELPPMTPPPPTAAPTTVPPKKKQP